MNINSKIVVPAVAAGLGFVSGGATVAAITRNRYENDFDTWFNSGVLYGLVSARSDLKQALDNNGDINALHEVLKSEIEELIS